METAEREAIFSGCGRRRFRRAGGRSGVPGAVLAGELVVARAQPERDTDLSGSGYAFGGAVAGDINCATVTFGRIDNSTEFQAMLRLNGEQLNGTQGVGEPRCRRHADRHQKGLQHDLVTGRSYGLSTGLMLSGLAPSGVATTGWTSGVGPS